MTRETTSILIKGHVFGLLFLGVFAGLLPLLVRPLDAYVPWTLPGVLRHAGIPLFLAGVALDYWCLWLFIFQGRGTALPLDPPQELVVSGPYKYVRNPIVVGVLAMLLGEALYFASPVLFLYLILATVVYHLYLVYVEEPELKKRFGKSYEEYEKAVPRGL
jgi:protein-S-isoprenylcysteine O-methyltransferase Ste14